MIVYKTRSYVDTETGEQQNGILTTEETLLKDQKRREAYKARQARTREYRRDTNPFTFYFMSTIRELLNVLQGDPRMKNTYLGYLLVLNTHLKMNTNVLYEFDNVKKPLNRGGIARVLKIGNGGTSKKFIDFMIEKGVLLEVKTDNGKGFAINEQYSLRGSTDTPEKLRVYHKAIRQMYEDIEPEDFSFIYSLIPYVEYDHNMLAHNPYETDISKLDTLDVDDIAEITGLSSRAVYYKLNRLKLHGHPIFITVKSGGGYYFIIDPDVLARKYFAKDDKIRNLFKPKAISPKG